MSYAFQTPVGRPVSACLDTEIPAIGPDKWQLLSALTEAADSFGLGHRPLSVLRALLSFLPERHIPDGPHRAVVFPANHTLSDRLGGMPESTLRRHIATLVKCGIVSRQDSPNRKRYARRVQGGIKLAFGIDLAPLASNARAILDAARAARRRAETQRVMRDRVIGLRHQLIALDRAGEAADLCDDIRRMLRRKLDETALAECRDRLETAISDLATAQEMSGDDTQNERHIQEETIILSDSETPVTQGATSNTTSLVGQGRDHAEKASLPTLRDVIDTCPGFQTYFPDTVESWRDLEDISDRLGPMMGIDPPVLLEAKAILGRAEATVAVLCILERLSQIKSPGAYLRRLTQTAPPGRFSVAPMLSALKVQEIVS